MDDMFPPSGPTVVSNGPVPTDPMSFVSGEPAAPVQAEDPFASMAPPTEVFNGGGPGNELVKAWEAENEARISKKSQLETAGKKKKRENAQKELQKFYEDRKLMISKNKNTNRADEKEWLAVQGTQLEEAKNPWERVLTMCTDPKASAEDETTIDTSRFKSLLINLKAEPIPN